MPHTKSAILPASLKNIKDDAMLALSSTQKTRRVKNNQPPLVYETISHSSQQNTARNSLWATDVSGFYLVCSENENPIAFADVTIEIDSLHIEGMYVLQQYQNLGIGKELVYNIASIAVGLGRENMELSVYSGAAINSAGFYKHLGFIENSKLSSYYSAKVTRFLKKNDELNSKPAP